jgi:hypothetical protein
LRTCCCCWTLSIVERRRRTPPPTGLCRRYSAPRSWYNRTRGLFILSTILRRRETRKRLPWRLPSAPSERRSAGGRLAPLHRLHARQGAPPSWHAAHVMPSSSVLLLCGADRPPPEAAAALQHSALQPAGCTARSHDCRRPRARPSPIVSAVSRPCPAQPLRRGAGAAVPGDVGTRVTRDARFPPQRPCHGG